MPEVVRLEKGHAAFLLIVHPAAVLGLLGEPSSGFSASAPWL